MSPLLTAPRLRALEKRYAEAALMEKAGAAALQFLAPLLSEKQKHVNGSIVIVCGPGNNGGDGLTLARLLREQGFAPCVIAPATAALPPDAAEALTAFLARGGVLHTTLPDFSEPPAIIVDALFGIGLNRALGAPFDGLIRWINDTRVAPRSQQARPYVVSLDIPSGLSGDTGIAYAPTVRADATLSFIALKPGLLTLDGPDHCGELHFTTLDIPADDLAANAEAEALHHRFIETHLPLPMRRRFHNVHKGRFGCLGIVGGATGMSGAPLLAGRAAARLGAGKIRVGFLGEAPLFDPACPELMLHPASAMLPLSHDAWAVGCGLGLSSSAAEVLTAVLAFDAPLLLDADALTLLGQHSEWITRVAQRHAPTVLTPHPAEAARLLQCSTDDIQRDRPQTAREIAQRYRAHTVLKGSGSIIAAPEGSWCINATGNPALSFGGSGDVLTGMIGALLAQGVEASLALRYAVCLHGAAADALVKKGEGPLGVLSEDLIRSALGLVRSAAQMFID
ncbi:MAG: NAD(P)H-hydrate dehydratase [Betaproteobacteria bacterium]|nr:NAD(P)H-hydrate dehydratase [Betaproteobacteria bacterium]